MPKPELSFSDDETDLLDYEDSPARMELDVNMVCTLLAEFQIIEEKIAQLCLGPRNVVFEKPEESTQHLKPLHVRGHIEGKPISRMLVDGGEVVFTFQGAREE